ncbi:DinB family protein [Bacillus benzoevorans]|uniref:Putative damage-inducible protein DinB n=1 Tax=Bacillus benzoevorans TaxID=1456 RepID=A0A7X0HRH6_9BACI|nr:DinB family protein [Bacillus benzoevorans]MBB6444275.1 putative damage-inducible protein DinB [Bacillus benzoevorans]
MKQQLMQILQYDYWANKKLLDHIKSLQEEIFCKEMNSVFPTLAETFYHIFRGQRIWIKRCIPDIVVDENTAAFADIAEAQRCILELHQVLVKAVEDYFDKIDVIEYRTNTGAVMQYRFQDIIYHLVNHGSYHRGNIASMIRECGYQGTSTDYIVYLRTVE